MIKKFLLQFIIFPVKILKKLRDVALLVFKSLHLSMRRKINFDYLAIYIVTSLITILFVPLVFSLVEIREAASEVNLTFNKLFVAYSNEDYSESDLELKVKQLSDVQNVSFQVLIYDSGSEQPSKTIKSNDFEEIDYPKNILEGVNTLFKYKLVAKHIGTVELHNKQGEIVKLVANGFYKVETFKSKVITLGLIVLIFHGVGFLFMAMIGGARVKKVLNPIFFMTKTAEQISISNINMRLDVESTKYELKDLAFTLNEMLDRFDKDYEKQKRFVSDVSHELRTPISIINGYASMLVRWGKEDEEILNESIEAIIGESKNMQHLVENLLTLVRSDNQTLQYDISRFDIGNLICEVVKEFNMVNTKNQYITCDSRENIFVQLDEAKIKQTLRIFIDNAVKYTPDNGGIQVKCYPLNDDIYIHIKDTGLGISKRDLPFLFERFYRSDESRTRQTGGHGLGLSIAKVMILGHHGKITVKSRIGKGSEFVITLPKSIEVSKGT